MWMPSLLVASGKIALPHRRAGAPIDEDRALQLRERAEIGPARDLGLGDEGAVDQAAEDRNVEIRGMVRNEERRMLRRRLAQALDAESQYAAAEAVIVAREAARERLLQEQQRRLDRPCGERRDEIEPRAEEAQEEAALGHSEASAPRARRS
jgi:hypothetical protein